ncbi:malonyl-CoA decarboxylase (MCD) [Thraustotheca clavata]|uniref:Malonyl-CoA decarboxylase (MCD) n=1 Tax=Thraustotheca clavata TaxID=74557 RepID=A0A1W0ABP8_9STRA|nr:malonyl-CoA decarboxylase (MCD) [Thraustotheca clavata]
MWRVAGRLKNSGERLINPIRAFSSLSSQEPISWSFWRQSIANSGESTFLRNFQLPRDRSSLAQLMRTVATNKERHGDFVPRVVIQSVCKAYKSLDFDGKRIFQLTLARDLHVDASELKQQLVSVAKTIDTITDTSGSVDWDHEQLEKYLRSTRQLRESLTPLHELLFHQVLSQLPNGMLFLVQLRADVRQTLSKGHTTLLKNELVALRALDSELQTFLAAWFSVGFLSLERVTYERSSGALLEKIIRYEAVHPVGTIIELKRRLGRGRRCYAFFHPSVPEEPLVFVHVALVPELASSMGYIKEQTEVLEHEHDAKAAIFYSISSTQPGLQGVDLGNYLIKEVAKRLQEELPNVSLYSTLSPIPGFTKWLQISEANVISPSEKDQLMASGFDSLLSALATPAWNEDQALLRLLKPILLRLGAHYIMNEKKRGKALCPVANFHLRNGAIFERLNWLGDPSPKGLSQSAGLMVNYKYDLNKVEANNEQYLLSNTIAIGEQPKSLLNTK